MLRFLDTDKVISESLTKWRSILAHRRMIVVLALVTFCLAGGLMSFYSPLSAKSTSTPQPNESTHISDMNQQVQDIEKNARVIDSQANIPSIWPTMGSISSNFGSRNAPIEGASELHQGIDIASNIGMPVVATADGTVIKSGWANGYGNLVQIDHGNGIETIYGHNSQIAVAVGQKISKGQLISYVGSTGISTGPHVHYEVRENGTAVNPIKFLVKY